MDRTDTRTESIAHEAQTENGQRVRVVELLDLFRIWEPFANSWSDWCQGRSSFHWGAIELSLRADGNWETTESPTRVLTRLR